MAAKKEDKSIAEWVHFGEFSDGRSMFVEQKRESNIVGN